MTRSQRFGLSTLLSVGFVAGAALAQQQGPPQGGMPFPPGGMMGMMGGPGGGDLQLVANAAVQKELDLTAKQKSQLRSVEESAKSAAMEFFATARENGGIDQMAVGEHMTALRQDLDAKVGRVLDKKQKTRLGQIKLQRDGLIAVTRSDVASKLKINNPQSKQIKKVVESMNKEITASMPAIPQGFGPPPGGFPGGMDGPPGGGGGGDEDNGNGGNTPRKKRAGGKSQTGGNGQNGDNPDGPEGPGGPGGGPEGLRATMEQAMKSVSKARESATKQIQAILTDDQKAAWTRLIGEPFDVSALMPTPGGPGGPREKGQSKKTKGQPKQEADENQ
jgi:hypothetical protein